MTDIDEARPAALEESLRIDYMAPIPAAGISGRSKATSEKAAALMRIAPGSRSYLLGRDYEGRAFRQFAGMLQLELRYAASILLGGKKPDAIVTRSPVPFGALLVGSMLKIPVVKELHTDIADETPVAFAGRPGRQAAFRLLHRSDVWTARRASGIIFNNTALERHFRSMHLPAAARTTTVPNGTDVNMFKPLDRRQCREELGLEHDRRYLVWAGAINPWHGVDRILELADRLPAGIDVLIVGKAESNHARDLISRHRSCRACFTGSVPPDVAARYMNAADACLLPVAGVRVSPGSPLKLYDYAACGVPIICQSDTEGYSDVVLNHGIGIAVDFEQLDTAAQTIVEFLPGAGALREHVRRVAVETFAWEHRMLSWMAFARSVGAHGRL